MTRDELIKAINDNEESWSCPEFVCHTDDTCLECAEKQLAEYDKQIRDVVIDECIEKLAETEDTILSDRQYYTLMELKGE